MVDYTACNICILVSNGFDNRELGLDDDHSTPAVHYRLEPSSESELFDRCDYCEQDTQVRFVHEHDLY